MVTYVYTMFGQLVKITATRKLMIKIDQETFDKLYKRQYMELKRNKMSTAVRMAAFELEDDDGNENQFVTVTLDKYDKQLLERKFEPLLKKHIIFQCRTKAYDFIPEGQTEQVRGVNLEITSIGLNKKVEEQLKKVEMFSSMGRQMNDQIKHVLELKPGFESESDEEDEHVNDPVIQLVAELERQEMAGTLPPAPVKKLTPIEQMMQEMEESEELPEAPPALVRQTGATELQPTEPKRRRRVTLPVA